jgi:hypothetical protein
MLVAGTDGRRQACESDRGREREAKERNVEDILNLSLCLV